LAIAMDSRMSRKRSILDPIPKLLGGVPKVAMPTTSIFMVTLGQVLAEQRVLFPGIRYSAEFENASNCGNSPLLIALVMMRAMILSQSSMY